MTAPLSLQRSISPPPISKSTRPARKTPQPTKTSCRASQAEAHGESISTSPSLAAVEAGEARISDHLTYFSTHLKAASRPQLLNSPRISIPEWKQLYQRNQYPEGRHFVIHQHDHPISGVHYDLRLQFCDDSSISFAIPYGLPGNPNSLRPMRMAIETRVHCLWNHLIESASHATGSLVIWDSGEYEVISPASSHRKAPETDDEDDSTSSNFQQPSKTSSETKLSDSQKLRHAFQGRHIRLRLHGTRLPKNYTLALRLPVANDTSSKKPRFKRRKRTHPLATRPTDPETTDEEAETSTSISSQAIQTGSKRNRADTEHEGEEADDAALASGAEEEDELIRANNAYPGSSNTIGSVHQRKWFLSLDKVSSGFVKSRVTGKWECAGSKGEADEDGEGGGGGWEAFFVRGRDCERSVVTGRLAEEVMGDEGVVMYKGRKMWRPILE